MSALSESITINGPSLALVAPVDLTQACLATPAFRAIRRARPDLSIVIICPKDSSPLWTIHFPQVLSYSPKDSPQQLAKRFSSGTFHSAIILEDSRAARALSRLGVPQRIGFDLPELDKLLTDKITYTRTNGPQPHRVTRYLNLAEQLACDPRHPENFAPPTAQSLKPSVPRIALAPDSDLGPACEWPNQSFLKLTEILRSHLDPEFFLLSLPGKSPHTDKLAATLEPESSGNKSENPSIEGCDLGQLLSSLPKFSLLIAPYGSLVHLAAHLGLPTITLMGPQDPRTHRPLGKIHSILNTHAECSPCNLAQCPLDHRCMKELSPETVAQAALSFFPEQGAPKTTAI